MHKNLIKELKNKEAVIAIVGLGYVGLPLMMRYTETGYKVIGIDIDSTKTSSLMQGKSYIGHIPDKELKKAIEAGFEATTDFSRASEADAIIICVPTPLDKYRAPDLSFVTGTTDSLVPYLRKGQVFSLESTTYPGTTEEELKPRIESRGFKIGKDYFLVYSPEREDPANPDFCTKTIPKVCGGVTKACREAGIALYEGIIDKVVPVSSTQAAEMTKLLENIHRAVNIGLVNEMKMIADKMGIDIYEVIRAASTKPFGFVPYYPGPGLGGHCIPIDPFYLTWKARGAGINTRFIELAGEVNSSMPQWVIAKVVEALNNNKKSVAGSKILLLGLSYKKDVDDIRESPTLELMKILKSKGAEVAYSDPHIPVFPRIRKHNFNLSSINLTAETIAWYDCIIIATNHSAFDYELIQKNAKIIIDTRGIYNASVENVVNA
ncbi:MAG: nucleotide sugar dehydrogenase [Verrucomicrobiota bacterium]|nr:nucleotide sugar dehydrogenase [Verrucomicrobiota bacterium]